MDHIPDLQIYQVGRSTTNGYRRAGIHFDAPYAVGVHVLHVLQEFDIFKDGSASVRNVHWFTLDLCLKICRAIRDVCNANDIEIEWTNYNNFHLRIPVSKCPELEQAIIFVEEIVTRIYLEFMYEMITTSKV